jgi:hypothetical protein
VGGHPRPALLDDPVALRHHEQVAAAVRDVTAGDRLGDRVAVIDLIAPDHSRQTRHSRSASSTARTAGGDILQRSNTPSAK